MRPLKALPDYNYLVKIFEYDKEQGVLIRRRTGNRCTTQNDRGYITVSVCIRGKQQTYQASRIIWKLVHKVDPVGLLDHINGVVNDNRLQNLREAGHSLNAVNSGQLGYSVDNSGKRQKKLRASLYKDGVRVFSKHCYCPLIARQEYVDAVKAHYGIELPFVPSGDIVGR